MSHVSPFYGKGMGLSEETLQSVKGNSYVKASQFNSSPNAESNDSVDEEEWLDPLTGTPSQTQTGIGTVGMVQDPGFPANATDKSSRLENMLWGGLGQKMGLSDTQTNEEQSEQWAYIPGWHTVYWGNVGWIIPDGFEIDETMMSAMAGISNKPGKALYWVIVRAVSGTTPVKTSGTDLDVRYWWETIKKMVGTIGQAMPFNVATLFSSTHRWYLPAYRTVAFGRYDATVIPEKQNLAEAKHILNNVAYRFYLTLEMSNRWIGTSTMQYYISPKPRLSPIFGYVYTQGPGFQNGESIIPEGVIEDLMEFDVFNPTIGTRQVTTRGQLTPSQVHRAKIGGWNYQKKRLKSWWDRSVDMFQSGIFGRDIM